jgi:hypothetical protein
MTIAATGCDQTAATFPSPTTPVCCFWTEELALGPNSAATSSISRYALSGERLKGRNRGSRYPALRDVLNLDISPFFAQILRNKAAVTMMGLFLAA